MSKLNKAMQTKLTKKDKTSKLRAQGSEYKAQEATQRYQSSDDKADKTQLTTDSQENSAKNSPLRKQS